MSGGEEANIGHLRGRDFLHLSNDVYCTSIF